MTRYIDADAFRRSMYEEAFEKDSDMQKWNGGCWIRYKLFENTIDAQPSADVRENVRGEWLEREVTEDYGQGIQEWQQAKCSVCGKWHTTPYMYYFTDYDFCPNCGADMRGEK